MSVFFLSSLQYLMLVYLFFFFNWNSSLTSVTLLFPGFLCTLWNQFQPNQTWLLLFVCGINFLGPKLETVIVSTLILTHHHHPSCPVFLWIIYQTGPFSNLCNYSLEARIISLMSFWTSWSLQNAATVIFSMFLKPMCVHVSPRIKKKNWDFLVTPE